LGVGTELNEGTLGRLITAWARRGTLLVAFVGVLFGLISLLAAAGAAQALTLRSLSTPASVSTGGGSAASLAGDAWSLASSLAAQAASAPGAVSRAAAQPGGRSASGPSAGDASPVGPAAATAPASVDAAVRAVRETVSGSVPQPPAPGDSPSGTSAPAVATNPRPVVVPSSVQTIVASALQKAGVTSGPDESDPVPVIATRPWPVAGTVGPELGSEIASAVGDPAARIGLDPRVAAGGSQAGWGAAALSGRRPGRVRVDVGRRRLGPGRRRAGHVRPADRGHALSRRGVLRMPYGRELSPIASGAVARTAAFAGTAPGSHASRGVPVRRLALRPARAPESDSTQTPPLSAPAPAGLAVAGSAGGGGGVAAVALLILAATWLLALMGGPMSLEAAAWWETLLSLRLERPG
jgi:hypothetical protein